MRRWLTNWRSLAAVGLVLVILGVALWPESVEVDLARAARGPLQVTLDDEGATRVRERFMVSAPVAGRCGIFRQRMRRPNTVQAGECSALTLCVRNPTRLTLSS